MELVQPRICKTCPDTAEKDSDQCYPCMVGMDIEDAIAVADHPDFPMDCNDIGHFDYD